MPHQTKYILVLVAQVHRSKCAEYTSSVIGVLYIQVSLFYVWCKVDGCLIS